MMRRSGSPHRCSPSSPPKASPLAEPSRRAAVGKLFALLVVVIVALAAVVGAKTMTMPSRQLAVAAVAPVQVDGTAAAGRLAAAVRFKTIASAEDADANGAEVSGLAARCA